MQIIYKIPVCNEWFTIKGWKLYIIVSPEVILMKKLSIT